MTCALTSEQQLAFYKKIYKDISEAAKNKSKFSLEEYLDNLHGELLSMGAEGDLALTYLQLAPEMINKVQAIKSDLGDYLSDTGLSLDHLRRFIKAFKADLENVNKFVSRNTSKVEEIKKTVESQIESSIDPANPNLPTPPMGTSTTAVTTPSMVTKTPYIPAKATGVFTTTGQQALGNTEAERKKNIPDPSKQFYYNFINHISDKFNNTTEEGGIIYPGVDGGLFLTAMAANKVDKEELDEKFQSELLSNPKLAKDYDENLVLMVVTDQYGDIVRFNEKFESKGRKEGRPIYYSSRRVPLKDTNGIYDITSTNLAEPKSKEQFDALQRDFKILEDIKGYVNNNRVENKVRTQMSYGSLGTVAFDFTRPTQVSKLNFTNDSFNPKSHSQKVAGSPFILYFTMATAPGIEIPIHRSKFDIDTAQKIADLIVEDSYMRDGSELTPVSLERKKESLRAYLFSRPSGIDLNTWENDSISIQGVKIDLKNKEAAKDSIKEFLLGTVRYKQVDESRVDKKRVIDISDPNYKSKLKPGFFLREKDSKGKAIYFSLTNERVQINLSLLNSPFNDFFLSQEDGKYIYNKDEKEYSDWMKDHTYIEAIPNNEGKIVPLNGYLSYTPLMEDLNKISSPIVEEKVGEVTIPQDLPKDVDEKIDDILSRIHKNNEFNKLAGQKSLNLKVNSEDIQRAKAWYEGHPISKYIPFAAMFNIVNTANPDSIAVWTTDGIRLYQGSDYTDLYHEAWHGFTQMFLTKEEKQKLYDDTRKKAGSFLTHEGTYVSFRKATDLQLEEYLAEEFRQYMLSGGKAKLSPIKKTIFQKILDILNSLFFGTTTKDILLHRDSVQRIQDIFENLRVGNINTKNFSDRNTNFDVLNKGIEAIGTEDITNALSYEDSQMLVDTVDSLFSEVVDMLNSGLTRSEAGEFSELQIKYDKGLLLTEQEDLLFNAYKSRQTYKYTSSVVTSEQTRSEAYTYVKVMLKARRDALVKELDSTEDTFEKEKISDKIRILTFALAHFGDVSSPFGNPNGKGLISYHRKKSKYLSFEDKFVDMEKKEDEPYKKEWDRGGNEQSIQEKSRAETLYLVRSLHKVDKTGKPKLNYLGFPELVDFMPTLNLVAKLAENTLSVYQIRNNIVKAIENDNRLELKQLLSKLGPIETNSAMATDMWTHVSTDLANARIKLSQMTLNEDTKEGTYTFRAGETSAVFRQVGRIWEDQFGMVSNNPLIKRDSEGNYLDLNAVLLKYKKTPEDSYQFYRDIGIMLSDKPLLVQAVNAPGSRYSSLYFYEQIKMLKAAGIEVRSLKDLVRGYVYGETEIYPITSRYNALQQLELVFSDTVATSMVTNAEGNQQSEFSLNSTLSKMIISINTVDSFDELMKMPEMNYLNSHKSPLVKSSKLLNSIFDFSKEGGPKRQNAKVVLENLSGLQKVIDDAYPDAGIASASADPASKLIMDFHMFLDKGITEATRHSDKGTTYGMYVNKIVGPLSTQGKYYVDLSRFLKDPESTRRDAAEDIIKYISDEYDRIQAVKSMTQDDPARHIPVGTSTYYELGQKFQIFDDVLSPSVKERILAITPTKDLYAELRKAEGAISPTEEQLELRKLKSDIKKDIIKYFTWRYESFRTKYTETPYINIDSVNNNMRTSLERTYGLSTKDINKLLSTKSIQDRNRAAVEAYVYNSWIHNYETVVMFYGDPAMYNMAKEEFHKRNAAISSTGIFARTDSAMIDYVNNQLKNPYVESKWYKDSGLSSPEFKYNGMVNTAVLEDPVTASIYYDSYKEIFMKDFKDRNDKIKDKSKRLSDAQIEAKVDAMLKPYTKMQEGDAQGWITFDMYRIMLKSMGKWTQYQENLYQDVLSGKSIDRKKLLKFFPVKKFQYFGPLHTSSLTITAFHKFSLSPLIPSVVQGTPMETLHNRMVEQNIGYALFKTGSKVGTITKDGNPDKFYNDFKDRSKGLAISEKDYKFTPNPIFVSYLKDQLETAPSFKEKVIFSTQLRKLIEEGLMEGGVASDFMPNADMGKRIAEWDKLSETKREEISPRYKILRRYEKHISELVELKKQELLDEVGGNIKGLLDLVRKELSKQDKAEHQIDFIEYDGRNKAPLRDLSMSLSADEIERLLTALVNKRIIRQKVNGEQFIQLSGAGYENTSFVDKFREASPGELQKYRGTNDLPTYHRDVKTGKTKAMKVKIALQGEFHKLLYLKHTDGNLVETLDRLNQLIKDDDWLDKDDHRAMITMVGVRIPVQGINSMEFMEVYEFLPEEAGNVLIPPAEIVAKSGSDFDIDKLSTIMPTFQMINGEISLIKPLGITESKKEIKDRISELSRQKAKAPTEEEKASIEIEISINKQKLNSLSTKAIENALIQDMKAIMELPENFISLIRPNGTDIFEDLAKELGQYTKDFDIFESAHGEKRSTLSPTKLFEIEYNLYKHSSNNIGKQTLGLGAVDNTFNTIFNRVGAYLEPQFSAGKGKRTYQKRQTILLPHNTISTNRGNSISLSHLYDTEGNHKIADIISQLINGWVDVAKDTWVFDIQGNKEVAPTLLLMIQAGVPVRQAVLFASQPLVRAYVEQQRLGKSILAGPLGVEPENFMYYRNEARNRILGQYLPDQYYLNDKGEKMDILYPQNMYNATLDMTSDITDKDLSETALMDNIKKQYKEKKSGETYVPSQKEIGMFLHYLEIEDMSKPVRDMKLRLNFDTSRSTSLFDAYSKESLVQELLLDKRLPSEVVRKILDESPIGSFNVQEFMRDLWSPLFPLRAHNKLNQFILSKMQSTSFDSNVEETFGDSETFINTFRDDLLSFIFQNQLAFSSDLKYYKGLIVNDKIPVDQVMSLKIGAFKQGDTLYLDKRTIQSQADNNLFIKDEYGTYYNTKTGEFEGLGLAKVNPGTFRSASEYLNFVLERETLRDTLSYDKIKDSEKYKKLYGELLNTVAPVKLNSGSLETKEHFETRMRRQAYETILRDQALDNILNIQKLFFGSNPDGSGTYAEELVDIKSKYPELEEKYPVIKSIVISKGPQSIKNLRLSERSLSTDQINIYHANIKNLANPTVIKVSDPYDNEQITKFFNLLPVYAFLQSGISSKSIFSMVKVMPSELITSLLEQPVKQVVANMNSAFLEVYYKKFLEQNQRSRSRLRTRLKEYQILDTKTREEVYKPTLSGVKPKEQEEFDKDNEIPLTPLNDYSSTYYWKGVSKSVMKNTVVGNPDVYFVYEDTQTPIKQDPDDSTTDAVIKASGTMNHIGLPTKSSAYYSTLDKMVILDENMAENKRMIDDAIGSMKELIDSGYSLGFSEEGYGQHLIGIKKDGTVTPSYKASSIKTFLYLSERLYESFGYINPNWLVQPESQTFLQSTQPITDQMVEEQLRKCFA